MTPNRTLKTKRPLTQSRRRTEGGWDVVDWAPDRGDSLRGWVERLWHARGRTGGSRYRVLPHGMVELIILNLGRFRVCRSGGTSTFPATWNVQLGTWGAPLFLDVLSPEFEVVGARLHPALASYILGVPLTDLDPFFHVPSEVLRHPATRSLVEALNDGEDTRFQLRVLHRWLRHRALEFHAHFGSGPGAVRASREIIRSAGAVRIAELAGHLGISKQSLATQFKQNIGVTPKRFARIHRFRSALLRLRNREVRLSHVAFTSGYCDQAHMTNEFKEMSGLTPDEFRRSRLRLRAPSFQLLEE